MKRFLFIGLVLLVLFSGCTSSSNYKSSSGNEEKKLPEASSNYKNDETEGFNENNYQQPELKEENIGLMEEVEVDYLTYKITKAETFTEMGSSFMDKETTGKFIKVYLEITNNSKISQYIYSPRLSLIDSQEREFDELPVGSMYIADGINFGEQLQPGLTLSGATVFEIPKDSTGLKLEISGDWLSLSKVIVTIDKVQDIGKDMTLNVCEQKPK